MPTACVGVADAGDAGLGECFTSFFLAAKGIRQLFVTFFSGSRRKFNLKPLDFPALAPFIEAYSRFFKCRLHMRRLLAQRLVPIQEVLRFGVDVDLVQMAAAWRLKF